VVPCGSPGPSSADKPRPWRGVYIVTGFADDRTFRLGSWWQLPPAEYGGFGRVLVWSIATTSLARPLLSSAVAVSVVPPG
jgi:hypothetical protein